MARRYGVGKDVRKYFDQMTDAQRKCGAYGHRWPELDLAKNTVPKGMRVGPVQRDGQFQVTEHCLRGCGKERTTTTLAEGLFDLGAQFRYNTGPDWVVIPREVRDHALVSRRVFRADLQEQARDVLVAAAERAAAAARLAEARAAEQAEKVRRQAS